MFHAVNWSRIDTLRVERRLLHRLERRRLPLRHRIAGVEHHPDAQVRRQLRVAEVGDRLDVDLLPVDEPPHLRRRRIDGVPRGVAHEEVEDDGGLPGGGLEDRDGRALQLHARPRRRSPQKIAPAAPGDGNGERERRPEGGIMRFERHSCAVP